MYQCNHKKLSYCKKIAHQHLSHKVFWSGPGRGCCFIIWGAPAPCMRAGRRESNYAVWGHTMGWVVADL